MSSPAAQRAEQSLHELDIGGHRATTTSFRMNSPGAETGTFQSLYLRCTVVEIIEPGRLSFVLSMAPAENAGLHAAVDHIHDNLVAG